MRWLEFTDLLAGLLSTDSRLHRLLTRKNKRHPGGDATGGSEHPDEEG